MKKIFLLVLLPIQFFGQQFTPQEISQWRLQSNHVEILRDNWGIPHIYGDTDADAVFGLMYAQCEDDFKRIELNYIEKLGRKSEVFGPEELYNDLYVKMIIDTADAMADYHKSPKWLKSLLDAYADGINYYLYTHPSTEKLLLHRFLPWYPLLWTDGSINAMNTGDVTEKDVENLFTKKETAYSHRQKTFKEALSGSNGFAVGPSKSLSGNSILYINPHVTFYFRPEVHMVSKQGLNVYGAVTWGQFFIYQGFNENCGWVHTSSNVDVADNYIEKTVAKNNQLFYKYNNSLRPFKEKKISIWIKKDDALKEKVFTTLYSHHGPVMAKWDGNYISVKSLNRSMNSLIQSWKRTKANGLEEYKTNMTLGANTSNNTLFADRKGNIAYWHGNFIPKRNIKYNWGKPVDGSTAATEWQGLHKLDEIVHVYNPKSNFIQNCNSSPFTVSGVSSPIKNNFPPYMAPDGENFRSINAVRLLSSEDNFTIEKMIAIGYNKKLSAFELLLPALIKAFEKSDPIIINKYKALQEPINMLKAWDYNMDENSIATTLAIEWAEKLPISLQSIYINQGEKNQIEATEEFILHASANELLLPLQAAIKELKSRQGDWKIPWGAINRYQRINNNIEPSFNDDSTSYPIGFASSLWGALPAYSSSYYYDSNKRYGIKGNSFVCAVEFGKKIKAYSLLAGGQSGDPASPHFNDQLERYTKGQFKQVLFYKGDVQKEAKRKYRPGE